MGWAIPGSGSGRSPICSPIGTRRRPPCEYRSCGFVGITVLSDGVTVYECTTDQQVIDLVRGGQGVFGIAIGQVWTDVQATLTHLPTETPTPVGEPTGRAVLRVVS